MFGRIFLLILSIVSLAWIIFIGYDLLDKKDQISPQHIFTVQDGEILIINRTNEVQTDKLDFQFNPNIKGIFDNIMKNVFPNERIYISQKRSIIIVELPRIWNEKLVTSYLKVKQIQELISSSHFIVRHKKNHLLITNSATLTAHEEGEWPLWDSKASASLIHLEKPLKSTNIYFKEDGTVYYQTKYGPLLDCKKIDDNDYFAQFLPSELQEYHFYEKEFALKHKIISSKSPLYQWMEDGMVYFEFENTACIISDYNKSVDPMQMLFSDSKQAENSLGDNFKDVQLCKNFPSNLNHGFYIGKLGDKVLMSEKKDVLEKVIAAYQLGNTLALNQEKLDAIYGKMPKKVSERLALSDDFYTLSSYKNLLIKTEIYDAYKSKDSTLLVKKDLAVTKINNSSFSTNQETAYFLGNGNVVFSIGKQNEIIALSHKKQFWKINLEGEIVGQLKIIDLAENGKQQLLVSTKNKIYLINAQDGTNVNEFPLTASIQNSVSLYRWNGKTNFLAVSTANELLQIAENGRIIKKLKLNISNVSDEVDVYKNGKTLTAVITGQNKIQTVDLDRNRTLKSSIFIPKNHLQLKTESGYSYFVLENSGLIRYNLLGEKKTILQSNNIKNLKKIYRGKEHYIVCQDKQTIYLINSEGAILQKTFIKHNDIEDFDLITMSSGKSYIAILEGIQNDIYLFDKMGNQVTEKTFEGKKIVKLSENQGKLNLTSTLERNIIQHYDVLSE